jgi:hypothetical protein
MFFDGKQFVINSISKIIPMYFYDSESDVYQNAPSNRARYIGRMRMLTIRDHRVAAARCS